jgi:AMP-polyphosphate phosphotransferase
LGYKKAYCLQPYTDFTILPHTPMFESAELGHHLDKTTYEQEVPKLRDGLIDAQYDLAQAKTCAVVILVAGMDGAGRGETINLLNTWMDPRYIATHALGEPTLEEKERPLLWRFWRILPPKGRIGIVYDSWATEPLWPRVMGALKGHAFQEYLQEIQRFEKMLTDEGVLLLKFWLHLPKKRQKERLTALEKDPRTRWRITDREWEHYRQYEEFCQVAEPMLRETSTAAAPWIIVEGTDTRYRELTIGKAVLDNLRRRLDLPLPQPIITTPPCLSSLDKLTVLNALDLSQHLEKADYNKVSC